MKEDQATRPASAPTDGGSSGNGAASTSGGRLPPLAFPILAFVFGAALVWSFSRILLVVNKYVAAAIALLTAINILVGAALVAFGGRVRRRPAAYPFLLLSGAAVIVAGVVAAGFGSHAPEPANATAKEPPKQSVSLTAQSLKFSPTELTFSAGGPVSVAFTNKDAAPHNFVLVNGKDQTAPQIFRGEVISGPGSTTYTFTAPEEGEFFFFCEVHPTTMSGTATVTAAPAASASGGEGGGSGLDLSAKGLAFSPDRLEASGGGEITIHFRNDDASIPHNVVVFRGEDATSPQLFSGEVITGPATADYTFTAPPPGTYFFHCQVHPNMTGTLVVR